MTGRPGTFCLRIRPASLLTAEVAWVRSAEHGGARPAGLLRAGGASLSPVFPSSHSHRQTHGWTPLLVPEPPRLLPVAPTFACCAPVTLVPGLAYQVIVEHTQFPDTWEASGSQDPWPWCLWARPRPRACSCLPSGCWVPPVTPAAAQRRVPHCIGGRPEVGLTGLARGRGLSLVSALPPWPLHAATAPRPGGSPLRPT